MSADVERYRYRGPVWMVPVGLLAACFMWGMGSDAPVVLREVFWLVAAVSVLAVIGTLASLVKQKEVVLTDRTITSAPPLRRPVCIDFAAVETLEIRQIWRGHVLRSDVLDIRAPGRKIVLWDKAFGNREAFDQLRATVAARVAAHGGPEVTRRPLPRDRGTIVA